MARHKLKPNLDIEKNMNEMISRVAEYFGEPYDDRKGYSSDHVSLRDISKEFNISVMKARKILITAGVYSIEQSRIVNELHESGASIYEIMEKASLSKASVQSYLPYSKSIYNLPEKTVGADRTERWRKK